MPSKSLSAPSAQLPTGPPAFLLTCLKVMATPAEISAFVEKVVFAMGLDLKAEAEDMPDGLRINLTGEDGSLLTRRQGEGLAALQHVVAAVFRQDVDERRRLVVDCQGYRKTKDA